MNDRPTLPQAGPCPDGCILPAGHDWEEVDPDDGSAHRLHQFYRSAAGYIATLQAETWSPLIGDSVLSEPFVHLTDDLAGELSTTGAGSLALSSAAAARACRLADKRWAV